eukprot:Clim_evm48s202 gene=Clim_evmTU48s202
MPSNGKNSDPKKLRTSVSFNLEENVIGEEGSRAYDTSSPESLSSLNSSQDSESYTRLLRQYTKGTLVSRFSVEDVQDGEVRSTKSHKYHIRRFSVEEFSD